MFHEPPAALSPREPRALPPADSAYWDALSHAVALQAHRHIELQAARSRFAAAEARERPALLLELDACAMKADRARSDARVVLARLEVAPGESLADAK